MVKLSHVSLVALAVALAACKGGGAKSDAPVSADTSPAPGPTHASSAVPHAAPPPSAHNEKPASATEPKEEDVSEFVPKHVPHDKDDHPVVEPLRDLCQNDKELATMFGRKGHSEICGPTAMSNALLFLKHHHKPAFPKLFAHLKDSDKDAKPVIEELFKLCKTDPDKGTVPGEMKACVTEVIEKAGYKVDKFEVITSGGKEGVPPTLEQVRAAAKAERATIVSFGWYNKETHKRKGGHFVTLAGYDAKADNVIYVTNPLVKDYPKDAVYSKVVLRKVTGKKDGDLSDHEVWETDHLFGNDKAFAVLESLISVIPK